MPSFATLPIEPMQIRFDFCTSAVQPAGPVLTRRMSSLSGLFAREDLRAAEASGEDAVVYSVVSSPVPRTTASSPSIRALQVTTTAGCSNTAWDSERSQPRTVIS